MTATPFHPDPGLFQQLGGDDGVHRLIDAFYERIAGDDELTPLFKEFHLHHGRDRVKSFFVEWLGGERAYYRVQSRSMRSFHNHLFISRTLAARWLKWFAVALEETDAPAAAARSLMSTLRVLAHHLVNDVDERRPLLPGRDLRCVRSKVFKEPLACIVGDDLAALQRVVDGDPLLPRVAGPAGRSLLWEAALRDRARIAGYLLERGADAAEPGLNSTAARLDAVGADLMVSPLCVALARGHRQVADLLRAHGAVVDVHTAAFLGDVDRLRQLLDDDPSLVHLPQRAEDVMAVTPLAHAVGAGQRPAVELLLAAGAEVEPHSRGLLDRAARARRVDLVRLLLERGADAAQVIPGPWVLDSEIARLLRPSAANLQHSRWVRLSCSADISAAGGDAALAGAFLDFGADVNQPQADGRYPLHAAAKAGFQETIRLFLSRGADVGARDAAGETPLHHTLKGGKRADAIAAMQLLLGAGANIDAVSHAGATVLHRAAAARNADVVAFLLLEGADPHRRNERGLTPLEAMQARPGEPDAALCELLSGFAARAA